MTQNFFIAMSILCFLLNFWWLLANVTGVKSVFTILIIKLLAFLGILLPILYWIKLLQASNYISEKESSQLLFDVDEILRIIGKIQKTTKLNS